jgi:tRNA U34 5-carboxymethylaminomethyl modifying GTPase MnmE/TrmE
LLNYNTHMCIIQKIFVILNKKDMKPRKVLLIAMALTMALGTYAQRINRGDVCQNIPDLTTEQKQEIDKLSAAHQQKMDRLRDQFYAELNMAKAAEIKALMNAEMKNHYNHISALLTPAQKISLDQNCYANRSTGSYYGRGMGRNGRGYRQDGQGYGRGNGRALNQGRGRGQGRGYGRW